jgi:hypothetical protein
MLWVKLKYNSVNVVPYIPQLNFKHLTVLFNYSWEI